MSHIRVTSDGLASHKGAVHVVDDDGNETFIPSVSEVELKMKVGDINKATLHVFAYSVETDAILDDLVVEVLPPERGREVVRRLAAKVGLRLVEDE